VNRPSQKTQVTTSTYKRGLYQTFGSEEQPILQKKGDNLRIDWGYFYVASLQQGTKGFSRAAFAPDGDRVKQIEPTVAGLTLDLGMVKEQKSTHVLLAYDDEYSIVYFARKLRPYWRRKITKAEDLLERAEK